MKKVRNHLIRTPKSHTRVSRNMKRHRHTFYFFGIQTVSNRTMFLMSKLLLKNKRKNLSVVQIDLHSPPAPGSAFLVLESLRKHKKRNYFGFACSRFFSCLGSGPPLVLVPPIHCLSRIFDSETDNNNTNIVIVAGFAENVVGNK